MVLASWVCGSWRPPSVIPLPLHRRLWVSLLTSFVVQLALCALHVLGSCFAGWGWLIAASSPPSCRFILLAAPRTGSTLLLGLLHRGCPETVLAMGEILNPAYCLFGDVTRCGAARQALHVRALLGWQSLATALPFGLEATFGLRRGCRAIGAKVFGEHLEACGMELTGLLRLLRLCGGSAACEASEASGEGNEPRVVVLYRRCLLEVFVSLQRAFATDRWCCPAEHQGDGAGSASASAAPAELDWDEFAVWAAEMRTRWVALAQELHRWSAGAQEGQRRRVLVLEYAEVAEAPRRAHTMRRVCDFLGASPHDRGAEEALRAACVTPPLLRQRTQPLAAVVRNYHALRLDEVRLDPQYCIDMHDLMGQPPIS